MDYSNKTKEELIAEIEEMERKYNTLLSSAKSVNDEDDNSLHKGKWQYAIENTTDGIWEWNIPTNKATFSKQWKAVSGIEKPQSIDPIEDWSSRLLPEDKAIALAKIELLLKNKTDNYSNEYRVIGNDGSVKWMRSEGKVIEWDDAGEPIRAIGTTKDITEQKKVELEYKERLKELNCLNMISSILRNSALSVAEVCTQIVRIIPSAWQFPDFTAASIQILDQTFLSDKFVATNQFIEKEIIISNEVVGRIGVYCQTDGLPYHEQLFLPEEIILLASIAENLSNFLEKDQYEKHLKTSETKYRTLIENINDVIYEVDAEGIICYISPAIEKILGYKPEDIVGKSFSMFVGSNASFLLDRLVELQSKDEITNEYKLQSKSGVDHWIRLSTKSNFKNGQFAGGTGTLIDITEKKLVDSELQNSSALHQSIISASPDIITFTDLQGKILFSSPNVLQLFGYESMDSILNHSIFEFIHPDDREQAIGRITMMLQDIRTGTSEYKALRADGSIFDIEVNAEFVGDTEGNKTSLVLITRDITTRKTAEEKLRKSEEIYRHLVETINEVIYEISNDGTVVYVSPAIEKITGYCPEELIGTNLFRIVHPEDVPDIVKRLASQDSTAPSNLDMRFISKQGEIRWARSLPTKVFENERVVGRTGILTDITQQKIVELELQRREESFRSMVENLNDVVYEVTSQGIINYVSPSIERFLGYKPEELIGKNFFTHMHEADRPLIIERLSKLDQRDYSFMEYRYYSSQGEIRWVRSSTNPMFEEGKMIGGRGVLIDITERKKAEEALQISEERLQNLINSQTSLVLWTDLQGKHIYWNRKFEEEYGWMYSNAGLEGADALISICDHHHQRTRETVEKCFLNPGKIFKVELDKQSKDGGVRTTLWEFVCLTDTNNLPYAIQCMGIDITDKREAELQLQLSEQKYKALFYDSPIGYLIVQNGKFIDCNKASEILIGGDRSSIVGKTPDSISPEIQPNGKKSSAYANELISEAIERGSTTFEWVHQRTNGSEFLARVDISVIEYQGNQVLFVSWLDITTQREAEEKLKESEQRFRMVFENVFDGISIFEEDTDPAKRKLVDCNERYAAMAGRTREELLKIGTTYSFSQSLDDEATEARIKGISEKQAYHGSFKWIRPDGKDNIIEYIAQPITLGGKTYSIGIDRDITEFKQKEDQLRKLSQAVEQSPVSIVITNLDGNIEYANPKAFATTGYSLEELKGQNPRVLKSGETSSSEYQVLWDSITHGNIWKGIFHNKRKNGELYWESSQITPITDSKGQITNYLALKEDITERKKMEEELTRSEERFRQITEQSQTVIWEVDANGMYTYVSPVAQSVWGYSPAELIGQKHFYDLHPFDGRNEFKKEVLASFAQKEIFRDITNQVLTKNKQLIWVSTNAVPILDSLNNLLGYRGADNDITARKQAESALKRSEELLNYAQEIAHMGNWSLDLTTNEMTWSKNYYRLLGLDPEQDVPRDHFMKMVHPEDVHLLDEKLEEMIQTKRQVSLDMRLILSDGTTKWVQNNVVPRFSDDIMVSMSGVNIDITEKKLAADQIRNQNDRLKAMISALPDLIFVTDRSGTYLEYFKSDQANSLLYPEEKLIGSNVKDVFGEETGELHLQKTGECLDSQKLVSYEYSIERENVSTYFEARLVPLGNDKVLRFVRDFTERKLKDNELKKLSLAIEQSPVSIVITDLNANIQYINPAFEKTTGYQIAEVLGKNTSILKSGQTDPRVYKNLWQTIESGSPWTGEWINKKKNGQLFWEYISITPIYNDLGKPINYLAVKQDISERKKAENEIRELNSNLEEKIEKRTAELAQTNANLLQQIEVRKLAEQALARSEKSYRMVVENVAEVIFQTDTKGNWVFLNKSWETITGFAVNESIGQLFINYVHPEDRARNWELFEPLIQRKKDYCRHEIRYLTKDGGFRWIEVFAKLGLDENDQIIGTYGTLQDITERKQAEETVQIQKERLESVIEGSSIGTWEWNIQTGETIFNERWAELIGYTLEELAPISIETWTKFAHPDDLMLNEKLLEKHFKGETDYYKCESRMRHKDGSWIWVLDSGKVISRTEEGKPLWMFGSHHDITEQKRAELFENELLQLSPNLTGVSLSEIDSAINLALSRIGKVLNADRSYIFEFSPDFQYMDNTYEWCNEDIAPQINDLQNVPVDMLPEWMKKLNRIENIIVESVKDLPESWKAEKEILEPQGIQSLVVIPMLVENKLIGFVGLDSVKTKRNYASTEINILKVWSSMLSSLISNQRNEKLLEQTRQNYETFFNTIDDFLFIFEEDGKIVDVNKTVKERLGYHVEDILNRSVLMVRPEDRREEALQVMEDILQGKADFCAIPLVTKSGIQIPVETRISKGLWNGKPAIFGVSKDISQIRLSEQKFASAFQSNSAIMTITRIDNGQFTDVNNAFLETFGYNRDEILGETLISLGIIRDFMAKEAMEKMAESKISVAEKEVIAYTKNGDLRTLLLSAEEILTGTERQILSVAVDITERKQAETEIRKAREEAEKANMAKSEFLSRMSHELRTPMNSILGFAQLLEMGELSAGQRKGVNHIMKSGRHLLDLINEVLDISRIEAGRLSLSLEPVQVGSVIPEMVDIIKPQASDRQIKIEFVSSEANQLYVKSDRQRLKQVLLNLLNNAIKYNKAEGQVVIQCALLPKNQLEKSTVRISISDTGSGISEEDIHKLFMPFERIGADRTSTEGTGLGLAVVKKLMEAMGGQVGVESILGEGSTFWIELPHIDSQMQMAQKSGQFEINNEHLIAKKGTILYIEDNASNIELIDQILTNQRSNIRLVSTMQGRQAVKLGIEYSPDLILLDLNLPDMHGSKVLKLLLEEERTKNIPIVVISADAMPQQLEKLRKAGARNYLTKPLDVTEFLKVIDEYIIS